MLTVPAPDRACATSPSARRARWTVFIPALVIGVLLALNWARATVAARAAQPARAWSCAPQLIAGAAGRAARPHHPLRHRRLRDGAHPTADHLHDHLNITGLFLASAAMVIVLSDHVGLRERSEAQDPRQQRAHRGARTPDQPFTDYTRLRDEFAHAHGRRRRHAVHHQRGDDLVAVEPVGRGRQGHRPGDGRAGDRSRARTSTSAASTI